MRQAIQIPSAAHCAMEYQRWAVRSQLRTEGHRFMRSMNRQLAVPMLHLRGDADPYVLPTRCTVLNGTRRTADTYRSQAQDISVTKRRRMWSASN